MSSKIMYTGLSESAIRDLKAELDKESEQSSAAVG